MSWGDEVHSCKDANVLLKMKLSRKLRQPAAIAWTGKSMSLFYCRGYWMRLCVSSSQWVSLGAQIHLSCIEVASMYVWWRETKNVCPDTWECKRALESVVPSNICQNASLIQSLNSEVLIMLQLMSEFSFVCGSWNVLV